MTNLIGIQGGPASYHEAAAKTLRPTAELAYFETFSDLFKALAAGKINSAVAAIANNRVQFIQETYDQLTGQEHQLQITGEVYLRVEHCLMAIPGSKLRDITAVHSQAPALRQCLYYLEKNLPNAHLIEEHDTAGSAELLARLKDPAKAAIASRQAAQLHGLEILEASVQDDPDNITRFLEISLSLSAKASPKADKTSVLLKTPQQPGALLGALAPFKAQGINLTSLQSRLIPNTAFDMMFFLEFDAGAGDRRTRAVLKELSENGYETIILGSYISADIPIRSTT